MIISVCGNGYSGSGAIKDYLHECPEIAVTPYDIEFAFLYDVDGIDDLRHHLVTRPVRFYSSDAAIKRYIEYIYTNTGRNSMLGRLCRNELRTITEEYIDKLVQLKWDGWWHFDIRNSGFIKRNWNFRVLARINALTERFFNKSINICPDSKMQIAIKPNDFDTITRDYVTNIVSLFNADGKDFVVLNQAFPLGQDSYYKTFFSDEVKTIYVFRDPRDVYISAKAIVSAYSSWIPTKSVEDFIRYYALLNPIQPNDYQLNENRIIVYFEDMIYKYNETTEMIKKFLGINFESTFSFFNPNKSINNTQLFRKYKEYESDIHKIEEVLEAYLYKYEGTEPLPKWIDSF